MSKANVAKELAEKLEHYINEVEENDHNNFYDDYIVDDVLDMHEVLYVDGVEEGRRYPGKIVSVNHAVKLFDTIEMKHGLTGVPVKVKVMSIIEVKPLKDGSFSIEFLAKKL